jgi:predicted lipid-binding transport protein (Tim44 family)
MGAQRQSIAPKPPAAAPNTSSQPVMPAQPGATLPAKPAAAPAAAAPSGMSRWLGPIAGIAAGLGIAALLSHLGLPEGLGTFLVLALLAIAAVFLVRMFLARRTPAASPLQYAGAGNRDVPPASPRASTTPTPNPVWAGPARPDAAIPLPAPAAPVAQRSALPAGFDASGFAANAKKMFVRMQAAHDAGDRAALADLMTPAMFTEVSADLAARGPHQPTEIVAVDAEVLEVATEGGAHWASVRYTGRVREDGEAQARPLDEVWNLTKPVDGSSGWLLAGIQQYA